MAEVAYAASVDTWKGGRGKQPCNREGALGYPLSQPLTVYIRVGHSQPWLSQAPGAAGEVILWFSLLKGHFDDVERAGLKLKEVTFQSFL